MDPRRFTVASDQALNRSSHILSPTDDSLRSTTQWSVTACCAHPRTKTTNRSVCHAGTLRRARDQQVPSTKQASFSTSELICSMLQSYTVLLLIRNYTALKVPQVHWPQLTAAVGSLGYPRVVSASGGLVSQLSDATLAQRAAEQWDDHDSSCQHGCRCKR